MIEWAGRIGSSTRQTVELLMAGKPHPEQGIRSCLGLLSLKKNFSGHRLENACQIALGNESGEIHSYRTVKKILERGLDLMPGLPPVSLAMAGLHENIRGAEYYAEVGTAC